MEGLNIDSHKILVYRGDKEGRGGWSHHSNRRDHQKGGGGKGQGRRGEEGGKWGRGGLSNPSRIEDSIRKGEGQGRQGGEWGRGGLSHSSKIRDSIKKVLNRELQGRSQENREEYDRRE